MTHLAHAPSQRQPAADGIFDEIDRLTAKRARLELALRNEPSTRKCRRIKAEIAEVDRALDAAEAEYAAWVETTDDDWLIDMPEVVF